MGHAQPIPLGARYRDRIDPVPDRLGIQEMAPPIRIAGQKGILTTPDNSRCFGEALMPVRKEILWSILHSRSV